jgi:hypothetical protein
MTIRTITGIRIVMGPIMGMSITGRAGMSSACARPAAVCDGAGQRFMRDLALASAMMAFLAPATPAQSQSSETLRAENEYRECLFSKSRNGQYAHNDRESDFGLLGECRNQWVAYMDVCAKAGFDNATCVMKSRLVIHAILNLTGK